MSDFIVSARKYRPDTFKSVVGQASITDTLINSISNQKLAHAYLFCGPRGVGKTTIAINLASFLNKLGQTVILIDANITTPNIGLYLNILKPKYTLNDVLKGELHPKQDDMLNKRLQCH